MESPTPEVKTDDAAASEVPGVPGEEGAVKAHFQSARWPSTPFWIAVLAGILVFVVFMERALRKIHIQYPRRQVGMKMYDGGSSHLPIKVNPAGVIPAIFASALLLLPTTISTFSEEAKRIVFLLPLLKERMVAAMRAPRLRRRRATGCASGSPGRMLTSHTRTSTGRISRSSVTKQPG